MRSSILYALATAVILASAGPVPDRHRILRRQNSTDPNLEVLGLAEQALRTFYDQLTQKFNGNDLQNAGFSDGSKVLSLISNISSIEKKHLAEIQSLSTSPLPQCTFNFSSALKDPLMAVNTARMMQYVTVGAYLGAVVMETDPHLVENLAEMGTNEGQNAGFLNVVLGGDPTAQSFALGMTTAEVLANFGIFSPSCDPLLQTPPSDPPLALSPSIHSGTGLALDLSSLPCANQTNFCQVLTGDDTVSRPHPVGGNSTCSFDGIKGPALVYITNSNDTIPGEVLSRSTVPNLCVGPALIVVDPPL